MHYNGVCECACVRACMCVRMYGYVRRVRLVDMTDCQLLLLLCVATRLTHMNKCSLYRIRLKDSERKSAHILTLFCTFERQAYTVFTHFRTRKLTD